MAKIVAGIGSSHVPNIGPAYDAAKFDDPDWKPLFDGYRPVRATEAMVAWTERVGRPELVDSGYIARRSRHNMGVAVDLTMVDLVTGTEVPMGTAFDAFSPSRTGDSMVFS